MNAAKNALCYVRRKNSEEYERCLNGRLFLRKEVRAMPHMVLGIGYPQSEYEALRREWRRHNVDFDFVDSTVEAVRRLR